MFLFILFSHIFFYLDQIDQNCFPRRNQYRIVVHHSLLYLILFTNACCKMKCLLIFDHLNDVIFTKFNEKFANVIKKFSKNEGLVHEDEITDDVIVQIFSPIVTSHRIMSCQFGNSYTSIQLKNGLNLYFNEYMGYLFVGISNEECAALKKFVHVATTIARYLCGPDVYQLRCNEERSKLAGKLLDSWTSLKDKDQAILTEAVEQLMVNPELGAAAINALKESTNGIKQNVEFSKLHALILVHNKLLSLYSSETAKELSPADILFLTILNNCAEDISSHQLLLSGPDHQPKCLPHAVHSVRIFEGVRILFLFETGNSNVSSSLYETFCHLHAIQIVQIQRDRDTLQRAFENLDLATRRLNDSLKKVRNGAVETSHKQLMKKWDVIKKKYQEYLRNGSDEALLRAETLALGFLENLKELLGLTWVDESALHSTEKYAMDAACNVKSKLEPFSEFLMAKSFKNFSAGLRHSLTINKYLEEFPGLVHFLYIDRTLHRVTTPTLCFDGEDTLFTKEKIWSMIGFARTHLQDGYLSLMWKDTAFSYSYFLWFEDKTGAAMKSSIVPELSNLPTPGILCEDFFWKLKQMCFPKISPSNIRCYELFCVHLGLITSSCVLEQTRRLAGTIWELKGHPSHAIDLL